MLDDGRSFDEKSFKSYKESSYLDISKSWHKLQKQRQYEQENGLRYSRRYRERGYRDDYSDKSSRLQQQSTYLSAFEEKQTLLNLEQNMFKLETMGGDASLLNLAAKIDRGIRAKLREKESPRAQFYRKVS